jgi:hypothetical protein
MKSYSTFVYNELQKQNIVTYTLFEFDILYRTGPSILRFCSENFPIEFNGNTYEPNIGLLDYTTPIQSNIIDRQSFNISLTDNEKRFQGNISNSNSGRDASIYIGFYNSDGTPRTAISDVILAYKGFIDGTSYSNDFEESIFNIELSSPMGDLSLVNTLVTTKSSLKLRNSDDTSFDKVIDRQEQIIKWGKEE